MDILSYLYPLYLLLSMLDPSIQLPEVKTIEYIGNYRTTGYYAPLPGQDYYFRGSYEADKTMNCGAGSCFHTANWYELSAKDEMSVVACPPSFALGTTLRIEGLGDVVCRDRWWSIKGKRLDIWNGIAETWVRNIKTWAFRDGVYKVYLVK